MGRSAERNFGRAAREITGDAKSHDASLTIIGTRARSELTSLVVGSVAHKVLHLADRRVLVVR